MNIKRLTNLTFTHTFPIYFDKRISMPRTKLSTFLRKLRPDTNPLYPANKIGVQWCCLHTKYTLVLR